MKLSLSLTLLLATASGVNGFAFQGASSLLRLETTALNSVGLYYSTSTGNTETVAGYIAGAAGIEAEEISGVSGDDIMQHEALIVGAPTWHTGADEQRSGTEWDDWLYKTLPNLDMYVVLRC